MKDLCISSRSATFLKRYQQNEVRLPAAYLNVKRSKPLAKLIKNETVLVVLGGASDQHPVFTPSAEIMSLTPYAKELHHSVNLDVTTFFKQPALPDHL